MSADESLLKGEMNENLQAGEKDVERMLAGFLKALLEEQRAEQRAPVTVEPGLARNEPGGES